MIILTSPFMNPFVNLSLEDYFLRSEVSETVLLFYVNRPCVVFGRFQNPWLETNLNYLVSNDIWAVRRQSGGGCVFHDEGNLNFSFITHNTPLDRTKYAECLREAFQKAGIELTISPRHDLWLTDREGVAKKISGSAYKQTKKSSLHHGTFLVNSDLDKLQESLKHSLIPSHSKSIPSVRSKVTTLLEHFPGIEIRDVIELVAHFFKTSPTELDGTLLSHPLVQESFSKHISWEWLWGETPYFETTTLEGNLSVQKGMILGEGKRFERASLEGRLTEPELQTLFPDFSEQRKLSNQIY
jgi:lipoate-protein ligase A